MTALIVAVKGGYAEVVKELLKRNPNVNMTDKDGNTALTIAAKEGYTEIVQDLLDAGTYVNIPDRVRRLTRLVGVAGHEEERVFQTEHRSNIYICVAEWRHSADRSREGGSCGDRQGSAA